MKPIKVMPTKTRRIFDETFKRETLNHWLTSGKSAELISQELGLTAGRLYAWKKPGSPAALQAQLDLAHREIRHLREQRDILKKTLGILSEPATSASPASWQ
ncbi:MAG: hypothetical protein EBS05_06875 [Proteobacteria bacterium]|nr:hypothetical protein [Pseudomonadota bacterium]